jgi:hypothetical protein
MRTRFPRTSFGVRSPLTHLRGLAGALLILGLAACGTTVDVPTGDDVVIELVAIATSADDAQVSKLDGATVTGEVTVAVRASGNLASVAFDLDGVRIADVDQAPYAATVDTRALADGAHALVATATLANGKTKTTRATFTVANGSAEPIDEPAAPGAPMPPASDFTLPPATLFVATNGNDANDGRSVDRPLRTITRAAQIVQPGDVVYLRGGVYPIQVRFDRSGTASQPIVWASYPGEWAILDGSDQTPVVSNDRVWVQASWNVFADFEVRNGPWEGIQLYQAHDNLFSRIVTHGHHTSGVLVMLSDRNRFEYLITYDNFDRYNPSGREGDDADGISISTGDRNVLYRVVSYRNSDDGIDAWRSTNTIIDSSISFENGLGAYGNGNGIKAGGNAEANHTIVRNSIAFGNKANGFDDNDGRYVTYYNNTAFDNGGYAFAFGATATLRNNLAVGSPVGIWGNDHQHNSWNLGINDPSFASTDPDHPDFLTLVSASAAIDAGTPVGLAYTGTAPDLGAVEHQRTIADLLGAPLTAPLDATTVAALGH